MPPLVHYHCVRCCLISVPLIVYESMQDLDIMGKKDEDALESMEGGGNRNGDLSANQARVV